MLVQYQIENNLSVAEFISVLENSGLADRRPVADINRIKLMIKKRII